MIFLPKQFGLGVEGPASLGTATIFSTSGFQNKSTFRHQSQFGTEMTFFLGVEAVFHKEICQSLKLCGTHLPILLIIPIARKRLLIVSCDI